MDKDFAIGDVVKLKSGGTDMTVHSLKAPNGDILNRKKAAAHEDMRVDCMYFDENGKMSGTGPLPVSMLDIVDKKGLREDDEEEGTEGSKDGVSRAFDRQDGTTQTRPLSPVIQSQYPETVHGDDDKPQTLGHLAESQPAQKAEVEHAENVDDPNDDSYTAHEEGKDYQSSKALKDVR